MSVPFLNLKAQHQALKAQILAAVSEVLDSAAFAGGPYVAKFEEDGVDNAGRNGGTVTVPRWKGFASVDWDQGPWTVSGRINYVHSYYQDFLAGSFFTPQDPRFQSGTYPERVPSYTTFDLYGRYNITANLSVSGSVLNIFNRTPPYDPGIDATNFYDFTQYDVRGTIYRVGVSYKFR